MPSHRQSSGDASEGFDRFDDMSNLRRDSSPPKATHPANNPMEVNFFPKVSRTFALPKAYRHSRKLLHKPYLLRLR
jgi:hypothetical protein